jgi:hypothetical protein
LRKQGLVLSKTFDVPGRKYAQRRTILLATANYRRERATRFCREQNKRIIIRAAAYRAAGEKKPHHTILRFPIHGRRRTKMKAISTSKKAIAVLMAILMIAAVSTISAFATAPQVFYKLSGGAYVPDTTSMAQLAVQSASYDADLEEVTVVFTDGPYYSAQFGGYYMGEITSVTFTDADVDDTANLTSIPGDLPVVGDTQTLTYYPTDANDYYEVTFDITLWACDSAGNITDPDDPFPHPTFYRYINVQ